MKDKSKMEKIDEQLNNLSSVEVPTGMHQFVMRQINYKKIKPVLIIVFVLFAFNFLLIIWHINAKLIETDFIDMVHDFFDVFNFNLSFINTIATAFFETVSIILVLSAALSLAGIIYIGKKINMHQFGKL